MSQRAAGSAYASGFVIDKNRPKNGPKFQYFVLLQEMEKRCISIRQLALELGLTVNVVKGAKGDFPLEKLDLCIDLLNNWTGPTSNRQSGTLGKPVNKCSDLQSSTPGIANINLGSQSSAGSGAIYLRTERSSGANYLRMGAN